MSSLDLRKVRILQAIVNDYVLTTRPVGSERLIEVYNLGVKSATVRNEMADLSDRGYILQPHTSAGRIPTDRGYRFYVDEVMDTNVSLSPEEVLRSDLQSQQPQSEIEEILLQTCRILSRLTSYPSLATDPCTDSTTLRHIYLTEASPRHILLVALLSTGHVEHRLIDMETSPADSVLLQLSNYVTSVLENRELEEIARGVPAHDIPAELTSYAAILTKITRVLAQTAQTLLERRIFLEGTSHFLRHPEFQDVQRLENLLNALEQRGQIYQVLSQSLRGCYATILIGAEISFAPMQDCSVISTPYHIGTRTAGYLGVVGPTRMQYERAAAAVSLMAQGLSTVLTNLSLA